MLKALTANQPAAPEPPSSSLDPIEMIQKQLDEVAAIEGSEGEGFFGALVCLQQCGVVV